MGNIEQLPASEQAKIEELRKLSPATAYKLYEVIEGASASRKEDHKTMEQLAASMREDMQKTLAETMQSVVVLVESLRTDIREQNKRITFLEEYRPKIDNRFERIEDDIHAIKEHVGLAI
jgi:hypothetical protein